MECPLGGLKMEDYIKKNQLIIDGWVANGWRWGQPVNHEVYNEALNGDYKLFLTPTIPIPKNWLGNLKKKKVLGLAAGGGQQGPILAALGAQVTIIDFSEQQILSEKNVATRENYDIEIIQGDISQKLPFEADYFDLIIHPVSNVYVQNVQTIWREAFRILKPDGEILSGLDNGINYIVDNSETKVVNRLPFNPLKNADQMKQMLDENGGIQFSHSIEEQIGGQLKAGLILKDIYSDTNGVGNLHSLNIPSFWATRSQKSIK